MSTQEPPFVRISAMKKAFPPLNAVQQKVPLLIFLCLITSLTLQAEPQQITVWVHGSHFSGPLFSRLSKRVALIEKHVFHCPDGLCQLQQLPKNSYLRTIAAILAQADPQHFSTEGFYGFGWNGSLTFKARRIAAKKLFDSLKHVAEQLPEPPEITIITHSHGGNVALNLAALMPRTSINTWGIKGDARMFRSNSNITPQNPFTIKRLVLLACPVQGETKYFATHSMFRKIYAIHSHRDTLQIMDPQALHTFGDWCGKWFGKIWRSPLDEERMVEGALQSKDDITRAFFSERHFPAKSVIHIHPFWFKTGPWGTEDLAIFPALRKTISRITRMTQRMMRTYKGYELRHIEFMLPSFLKKLPRILVDALKAKEKVGRDIEIFL